MFCAKNQHFEMNIRYETLTEKCLADVDKLDDYEIIELKKREENFHVELRELIEGIVIWTICFTFWWTCETNAHNCH